MSVLDSKPLVCQGCEGILTGRRKKWCSAECQKKGGREAWIKKTYGITMAEWNKIWLEQNEQCAICKRKPRVNETFHLDHEHQNGPSGPVRGIVCPYDNTRIIGRLKSHERAQALADYLRDPPATRALGREVIAPGRPRKKRAPRKRKK